MSAPIEQIISSKGGVMLALDYYIYHFNKKYFCTTFKETHYVWACQHVRGGSCPVYLKTRKVGNEYFKISIDNHHSCIPTKGDFLNAR